MTDEKKAPPAPATQPPTIAPRQAVPRPPAQTVPDGGHGKNVSSEHFALPEADAESLSKIPSFSGGTSSPVSGSSSDAAAGEEQGSNPLVSSLKKMVAGVRGERGTTEEQEPRVAAAPTGVDQQTHAASARSADQVDLEPRPAPKAAHDGPRKVKLAVSRVDPWSVMKLSFLLSVAIGIMTVVATWVFWYTLNDLGVFTSIDEMIREIAGDESELDILQYVGRDRVMSLATLIAVVDVVLLTALATIGAFLYNVVAALVGGIHLTMTDE